MRVPVLCCLLASLAALAAAQTMTAQTARPVHRPAAPATTRPASAPAHFSAAGLNDEDDLLRIYSGDFDAVHMDRYGTELMLIISSYMEDFAKQCTRFLPPNRVQIMQQVCQGSGGISPYVPSPDGVHDYYGNVIQAQGCSPVTVGTGLYADPQLYDAVKDVSAKAQVHMVQNMLGIATGKNGRAGNLFNGAQQVTDQLVAVGNEMQTVIGTNACGSPGLKNFQTNLVRFADGESGVKFAGAVASGPSAPAGGPSKDADFARLVDDLIADNARTWMVNRYRPGSVTDPIVSHGPDGNPVRIIARYSFTGGQGMQTGRVTVSFKDGTPDCLYFSDSPDNCRVPSHRVISAYEKNAYAKYGGAAAEGPFAEGCNAFMKDPRTSRFAPSDPDGYCKCLSNGYRGVMTPAQEAFYGKNFEDKFWRGIAQPTSDDPAWARLNPVAVSCME